MDPEELESEVADDNAEFEMDEDQLADSLEDGEYALEDDDMEANDEQTDEVDDEAEDEAEEEAEDDSDISDDVVVTLADGETVSLEELKSGYLKGQDYTHKTTEVAERTREVEAIQQRISTQEQEVSSTLQTVRTYLENLIPPEPSFELLRSDPNRYHEELALRKAATDQINQVTAAQKAAQEQFTATREGEIAELRKTEETKLFKALPHLKNPEKMAAWRSEVKETALEFGFTSEQVDNTHQANILQVMHYARLGKQAERNRANAKRRLAKPTKGKAKPVATPQRRKGAGMQRLSKSGSIDDAMLIDFD